MAWMRRSRRLIFSWLLLEIFMGRPLSADRPLARAGAGLCLGLRRSATRERLAEPGLLQTDTGSFDFVDASLRETSTALRMTDILACKKRFTVRLEIPRYYCSGF